MTCAVPVLRFLKCAAIPVALLSVFPVAHAEDISQAGDNPLVIDQSKRIDNITYLMGAAAERPSSTVVQSFSQPKHAWLTGVDSSEELAWNLSTQIGVEFQVSFLGNSSQGGAFELSVDGTNETLSFTAPQSGWQREVAGTLYIPSGTNTVRLRRVDGGQYDLKSLELIEVPDLAGYQNRVDAFKSDTSKLTNSDYGVMFQYGAWGYPQSGEAKSIDGQANGFDVDRFVSQMVDIDADYVIWSLTWWTYEMNAPIQAVDDILGHSERTSNRDLVGEIAAALDAVGIDFYLYYHTGHDGHLGYATTDWWNHQDWPSEFLTSGVADRSTFFNNWMSVVSEVGNRYGSLLDGWFFDDGLVYYPAPFEELGAAAKAGNPDRLVSYNPWKAPHYTEFEDVAFGEKCHSTGAPVGGTGLYTSTSDKGLYGHCMPRMENLWGIFRPDTSIGAPEFSIESATARVQDGISRKVPTSFNLMMYEDGTMSEDSLDVLRGLKNNLAGSSQSAVVCQGICTFNNTDAAFRYTGSWQHSTKRGNGDYSNDLHYTRSNGDYVEVDFEGDQIEIYMPVYNAGGLVDVHVDGVYHGRFDAKSSEPGSTANSAQNVYQIYGLGTGEHTVRLTKVNGAFLQVDSVTVLNYTDVVNNTDSAISYSGTWSYSGNRGVGDYLDDVQYSVQNGASAEYAFTGRSIQVFMPVYNAGGDVDVYLNGDFHGSFSAYSPEVGSTANSGQMVYEIKGLSGGRQVIRLEKRNGPFLQLDKLLVSKDVNIISNGKHATQSSTAHGGSAQLALDGNKSGVWRDGSVTHTGDDSPAYWRVDLGSPQVIEGVRLYNRVDCCSDRLVNYRVTVLDESLASVWTQVHQGEASAHMTVDTGSSWGRYVQIQLEEKGQLSLAEVQVFGSP